MGHPVPDRRPCPAGPGAFKQRADIAGQGAGPPCQEHRLEPTSCFSRADSARGIEPQITALRLCDGRLLAFVGCRRLSARFAPPRARGPSPRPGNGMRRKVLNVHIGSCYNLLLYELRSAHHSRHHSRTAAPVGRLAGRFCDSLQYSGADCARVAMLESCGVAPHGLQGPSPKVPGTGLSDGVQCHLFGVACVPRRLPAPEQPIQSRPTWSPPLAAPSVSSRLTSVLRSAHAQHQSRRGFDVHTGRAYAIPARPVS